MSTIEPRYDKEEFAKRGDAIYERDVISAVDANDDGHFVAIDIESGEFEIDSDELAASDRLMARHPDAQIWLRRIGSKYTRRFGPRPRVEEI